MLVEVPSSERFGMDRVRDGIDVKYGTNNEEELIESSDKIHVERL
jgi:hypothetical protein